MNKKEKLQEIRKIVSTALITAFGLVIALTWQNVISQYAKEIIALSPIQGALISAIIITVLGIIGILIITSLFKKA